MIAGASHPTGARLHDTGERVDALGPFVLVPIGRLIGPVEHYEGKRVDALHLPPHPTRPSLRCVDHALAQLRAELPRREGVA